MTLEDLAAEFGVSRERVRQIEVRAFEKVQSGRQGHDRKGGSRRSGKPRLKRSSAAQRRGWR